MELGYEVSRRGPKGEPRQVKCRSHTACAWVMDTPNAVKDDDAIVQAMFGSHLRERNEPGRPAGGHMRRARG